MSAPSAVMAGEAFNGTVSVANDGNKRAAVNITVTLPEGFSFGGAGEGDGESFSWTETLGPRDVLTESFAAIATSAPGLNYALTAEAAGSESGTSQSASASIDVYERPFVALNASVDAPSYVVAGEVINYSMEVSNQGTGAANDINVSIALPAGTTIEPDGASGWDDCTDTRCFSQISGLAPLAQWSQNLALRVDAGVSAGSQLTLAMSVEESSLVVPVTAFANTQVESLPALSIALVTLPTSIVALGDEFKALIEVSNAGSVTAEDTMVTLDVPEGASFVSALGGGTESGGVITWKVEELAPVNGATQLVASLRAPSAVGSIELTAEAVTMASLTGGGSREITARDTRSLRVDDAPVLDLQVTMSPDPVAPGDELAMRFGYQNIGHEAANDVVLTSRVPAETTLDLDVSTAVICSADPCVAGSTVTVNIDTLQGQERGTARLVLVVDNDTTALQISGSGALAGKNGVDALVPQAASASVQVVDGPILEVTQRADRNYVAPGELVTYQIDYLNRGLAAANDMLLDDFIPTDTRVVAAPGATATDAGVSWSAKALGVGDTNKVLVQLKVADGAQAGSVLDNGVELSTSTQVVQANAAPVTVTNGAVLETDIATLPSVAAPGKPLIYQVSYTNKGSFDATNVTLQMALPVDVSVEDCDDCTDSRPRLSWSLGTVPAGAQSSKRVVVTVNADVPENTSVYAASYISGASSAGLSGAQARALASLNDAQQRQQGASGANDTRTSNTSGPFELSGTQGQQDARASERTTTSQRPGPLTLASTLVARAPATEITVTATDQVIRGGQIGVDAVISNAGSATATGTTLETQLPAGTTLVYAGSQATCSANPCVGESTLSWSLGTLVPGAERSVSYALSVDADADLGQRTHVLTLASTEENEQIAEATTNVVDGALTLDKSVTDADGTLNPTYAEIGDAVTYTLRVVNDNPAAAPDLVVTDVLPAEVVNCGSSCLNLRGSGASLSGNTLTWSKLSLGAGEAIELSYGVTIPTVANNTALENLASVRSTTGQTDTDSARLVITSLAELGITLTAPAGLQPDASGDVVITYENTGTGATTATLTYLLPSNLSVTAADGASASGATYTWSLGSLAAGASGSKTLTVKAAADAPAGDVLTHFASLEGSASNLAADATDTTVIGSVEALAISVSAPSPLTTGDTFTATVVATNSGNTAADGTEVKLTVPAGFTVSPTPPVARLRGRSLAGL